MHRDRYVAEQPSCWSKDLLFADWSGLGEGKDFTRVNVGVKRVKFMYDRIINWTLCQLISGTGQIVQWILLYCSGLVADLWGILKPQVCI